MDDYGDKIFVAGEELDGKGHHLMIITYTRDQVEQLITEFQNIDGKKHLSEEKRVRAFLERLYKDGFLVAHVAESPKGVISDLTNEDEKETLINRINSFPMMTSEGYNGKITWVEAKKVIELLRTEKR